MSKIELHTPIKRGQGEITEVTLSRPNVRDFRGIKLLDLAQMDTTAMLELLPRITQPILLKQEIETMDVADFMQLSIEVAAFLTPQEKAAKTESLTE